LDDTIRVWGCQTNFICEAHRKNGPYGPLCKRFTRLIQGTHSRNLQDFQWVWLALIDAQRDIFIQDIDIDPKGAVSGDGAGRTVAGDALLNVIVT